MVNWRKREIFSPEINQLHEKYSFFFFLCRERLYFPVSANGTNLVAPPRSKAAPRIPGEMSLLLLRHRAPFSNSMEQQLPRMRQQQQQLEQQEQPRSRRSRLPASPSRKPEPRSQSTKSLPRRQKCRGHQQLRDLRLPARQPRANTRVTIVKNKQKNNSIFNAFVCLNQVIWFKVITIRLL